MEPEIDVEKDLFKTSLPLSKIKGIMKVDAQVNNITQDGVYAVTAATEMFLELLSQEAAQYTLSDHRKTVGYKDVAQAISDVHEFEFLMDIVPFTIKYKEALEKKSLMEQVDALHASLDEI
jgi:histone H3/H4